MQYKSLAHIPIEDDITDPVRSTQQLTLAYHAARCESRALSLAKDFNDSLMLGTDSQTAYHYLSSLLMLHLLHTSTIVDGSGIETSHYRSVCKELGQDKLMPLPNRMQAIILDYEDGWGGLYGTPAYYLYLTRALHYATPSQQSREAFQVMVGLSGSYMDNLPTLRNLVMTDPTSQADVAIGHYNPFPRDILQHLRFLAPWLASLEEWYLSYLHTGQRSIDVDQYIVDLLVEMARAYIASAMPIDNLIYQFLHQILPGPWGDLYDRLITLRNAIEPTMVPTGNAPEALLVRELVRAIPPIVRGDRLRQARSSILQGLAYPGGLNLYLSCLAMELLNRVHILSHPSTPFDMPRCNALLERAAMLLRMANHPGLNAMGHNLYLASTGQEGPPIREIDFV